MIFNLSEPECVFARRRGWLLFVLLISQQALDRIVIIANKFNKMEIRIYYNCKIWMGKKVKIMLLTLKKSANIIIRCLLQDYN